MADRALLATRKGLFELSQGSAGWQLGTDVHRVLPVVPILVADQEGDRAAERLAFAHAGEDLGAIRFDHHPSSASVSTLTAPQIRGDGIGIDREAGGKSFEYRDERLAMRLACGQKTQHRLVILHELSATSRRAGVRRVVGRPAIEPRFC